MGKYFKIRKEKDQRYIIFDATNRRYCLFKSQFQPKISDINETFNLSAKENDYEIIYCENTLSVNPNIKLSAPLIAYIEISNSCVLNCKHCFKSNLKYSHKINTEKIFSIIDDLERMGCFELRFVGFEAIFNDDLPRIVKYAKNKYFYVILNTCAWFERDKINYISELGFDEVLVSLDGSKEKHDSIRRPGSYDKVINLFEHLSSHNIKTRINMTVSNNNIEDMQHIADLSVKYNFCVGYTPFRHIGNGNENVNRLTSVEMNKIAKKVNELRRNYPEHHFMLAYHDFAGDTTFLHHPIWGEDICPASKNISILNDGRVFLCDFLEHIGDKYCGGNIHEEELNDIWQFSKSFQLYRDLKKTNRCYSCRHYENLKCTGGCASEILDEYNIYYDMLCYENTAQIQCEHELLTYKNANIYNERYYMEGKTFGISNYENYSWIPEKTNLEVSELIKTLGINNDHTIVDYGCAFGYYVKAFRNLKFSAFGIDISKYAIHKAKEDKSILNFICQSDNLQSLGLKNIDYIIAKDVLEHLTINRLFSFLKNVKQYNAKLFVSVPLAKFDGGNYICDQTKDIGHIIRRTEMWWLNILKNYFTNNVSRIQLQNFHLGHTNKDIGMGYFLCQ